MATKRKRATGHWEYVVRRKALLPKPLYLTFDTEAEGDAYVARLEAQLDRNIVPSELASTADKPSTLAQAIDLYRRKVSVSAEDQELLDRVREAEGAVRVLAIDFSWVEQWIERMKRLQVLAPGTIRHYVGALKRCLDYIVRRHGGLMPGNPVRLLPRGYASYNDDDAKVLKRQGRSTKKDVERDRRLAKDEEEATRAILAGAKPEDRQRPLTLSHRPALIFLFDLALESGMRLREMYTLTRDQIDVPKRTVFLDKTKNGDKRQVPLTSVALAAWKQYKREAKGDGPIFPWWNGDLHRKELKRVTSLLSRQWSRIFAAAGCPDFRFHDIRHEATSRFFERTNLGDLEIGKITGHRDPKTLARYANLRGSKLAERLW